MPANTRQTSVPTYSLAERDRRWKLTRSFMDGKGLDALLVFGEHEDAGAAPFCFDTWFTNNRAGSTVLFRKTDGPIVFMPMLTYVLDHIESVRRGDGTWVEAKDVRMGRDANSLADEIDRQGLGTGRIGVIGLEAYIPWLPEGIVPYQLWQKILSRFPAAKFDLVGTELAQLMMPLSEEEIAVVRYSATIGDTMAQAMVDAAHPGVSENEVYAAGTAAADMRGTVVPGMHFWSGAAPASGPPQWSYRPQEPRILQMNDYIGAEVFSGFGMRQTQHQVAITIGEVNPDVERCARIVRSCYDAGFAALRVGNTFGKVADAMLQPVLAAGGWVRGPQIHGLNPYGAMCRTPGGRSQVEGAENYPSMDESATVLGEMELKPGMSFSFEPSCGLGRHLVTIGGMVLVGDEGPIELNPSTAQLLRTGSGRT